MQTYSRRPSAVSRFELSAAALHIIAMALMLMDHLWATLLPAQDWLTCAGRLAFPIFAFMAVEAALCGRRCTGPVPERLPPRRPHGAGRTVLQGLPGGRVWGYGAES